MPLQGVTLIDLRPELLRRAAPLDTVTSLAVTTLSLQQIEDGQHDLNPAAGPLLVVCDTGARSALAARFLRADGLKAEHWPRTWPELLQVLPPPAPIRNPGGS